MLGETDQLMRLEGGIDVWVAGGIVHPALLSGNLPVKSLHSGVEQVGGYPGLATELPLDWQLLELDRLLAKAVGAGRLVDDHRLQLVAAIYVGDHQDSQPTLEKLGASPIFILVDQGLVSLALLEEQAHHISIVDVGRAVLLNQLGEEGGLPGIHTSSISRLGFSSDGMMFLCLKRLNQLLEHWNWGCSGYRPGTTGRLPGLSSSSCRQDQTDGSHRQP